MGQNLKEITASLCGLKIKESDGYASEIVRRHSKHDSAVLMFLSIFYGVESRWDKFDFGNLIF